MTSRRVALVTGASGGIGLAAVVGLARAGLHVVAGVRDPAKADGVRDALARAGLRGQVVALDVCAPEATREVVARIERDHRRLDVLVNNAGVALAGFVEDLPLADLRAAFETNFFGAVALTQAVLPGMRERWYGRIVNVSSLGGRLASPMFGGYDATKFALEGLSEALRHEVRPYGIHVSLIEPGLFPTDLARRAADAGASETGPNATAATRIAAQFRSAVELSTHLADPEAVGRAIVAAATVRRPRLRYVVGWDARLQLWLARTAPGLWAESMAWAARPGV